MHRLLIHTDMRKGNRCRRNSLIHVSEKLIENIWKPVLGTLIKTLFCLLPALISCKGPKLAESDVTADRTTGLMLKTVSDTEYLDIFTFNDDRLAHLDSYQRTEGLGEGMAEVRSQNGDKIIFVCANSRKDRYDWTEINSFAALESIEAFLQEESRNYPLMTGSGYMTAGQKAPCLMNLVPLASEVHLRSIRCAFIDSGQSGTRLHNVKVYLTNVNVSCSIKAETVTRPSHIVNTQGPDHDYLNEMREPDILMQKVPATVGSDRYMADIRLLCYPNSCETEGPGTPFTRLVIEGDIDGTTYWWPININRGKGTVEPGIHRNRRYTYDITLRRKGTSSPDDVIEIEDADIDMEIDSWNEKDRYSISF